MDMDVANEDLGISQSIDLDLAIYLTLCFAFRLIRHSVVRFNIQNNLAELLSTLVGPSRKRQANSRRQ